MKTILIIISILAVSAVVILFLLGITSNTGKALGIYNGKLALCDAKPNCVCSEYSKDSKHYIAPIPISENTTIPLIIDIIIDMGGTVHDKSDQYIAATFTSKIFKFTDDFEIRIDWKEKLIHIRSASRVGYSDAGVNRKRVELFKKYYIKK